MTLRGLQIWAHSFCRSTLATYRALGQCLNVPFRIALGTSDLGDRERNGFDPDEFAGLELVDLEGSPARAIEVLQEREAWHQLFGTYQSQPHIQSAISAAIDRGVRYGIGSEAPCNMFAPGAKRLAKSVYLKTLAPRRMRSFIEHADFILNWSGDDGRSLQEMGWDRKKIVPFGYFSPPLPGSRFVARGDGHQVDFHVLCTGDMTWHRGPDMLMQALVLLKQWKIPVRATFTSRGPLLPALQECARTHALKCDFAGFVSMEELVALYESCSLFVAPGRAEPWGMRVNDALQCGAPILISDGMGAAKLANDFGVGIIYRGDDPYDLAWRLRELIAAPAVYQRLNRNLFESREALSPEAAAARLTGPLMSHIPGWFADASAIRPAERALHTCL